MTIWVIIYILFVHWLADFVCQTSEMSKNKSTSNKYLTAHVLVYSIVTSFAWMIMDLNLLFVGTLVLFFSIFIPHLITDYVTSRMTSRLYKKQDYHNFFVVIGFDQFIHYATLLATYNWIMI